MILQAESRVLVFDEATSALDSIIQAGIAADSGKYDERIEHLEFFRVLVARQET